MKSITSTLLLGALCGLFALGGSSRAQDAHPDEPEYHGQKLSTWADKVLALNQLASIVNTNYESVQALRALGTNALPWLLREMTFRPAQTHRDQPPIGVKLPAGSEKDYHQLRARSGFWALGELAAPAIPSLFKLREQEPEFVPSALAGIGAPALPTLTCCLTNLPPHPPFSPREPISVASALGGLYVALDTGRTSLPQAAYLWSMVRIWSRSTNSDAAFWAKGILTRFFPKDFGEPTRP